MSGVADQFNMSLVKLRRINDLSSDVLKVGQTLDVTSTAKNRSTIRRISYRIKSGDSLSIIASSFRVSIAEITRWNKIKRSTIILPGQRLTLFIDAKR